MSRFQLSTNTLETRDLAQDNQIVVDRIERYRDRQPASSPDLIVANDGRSSGTPGLPEISAQDFSCEALRQALSEHGSLIVRSLFPDELCEAMIPAIDRTLDAAEHATRGNPPDANAYYNPPGNLLNIMPNKAKELANTRNFHRDSGSVMAIESPAIAESLLDLYEAYGLKDILTEYLGEPPCITAKKWVLRRSKLPVAEAGWHQDGAFMGTDINSVNMWLPLNRCGGTTGAPGMDVLPQRLHRLASAEGAQFDWSVSSNAVSEDYNGNGPLRPEFAAGDAFFFDHFFLHRTQYGLEFDSLRYAVETWFFGETAFPKNQIPLSW
ncbi:MAG: phytanoyl-CoA dioxygenase family protein [Pseudomonadota bacterium]